LEQDGPGYCLHEPMRRYGASTAALLERIHEVARAENDKPIWPHCDAADSSERRNCEREWRLRWSKPWNRVGVVPAVGQRISRSASSG